MPEELSERCGFRCRTMGNDTLNHCGAPGRSYKGSATHQCCGEAACPIWRSMRAQEAQASIAFDMVHPMARIFENATAREIKP